MKKQDITDRIDELREQAISRYLDKIDFDYYEWLTPKEVKELAKLEWKDGIIEKEDYLRIIKEV